MIAMTRPPMPPASSAPPVSLTSLIAIFGVLVTVTLFIFRDNLFEAGLNPQVPLQTAPRGAIPDYDRAEAWVALGTRLVPDAKPSPAADLFFVHGTTYASPERWNAPIDDPAAGLVDTDVLPHEIAAFGAHARVYAPRYRQATLYSFRTRSEDSRRARSLAYQDVRRAFTAYVEKHNGGRPFILAGIGQGGLHVIGLLQDEVAGTPMEARLVSAYVLAHPVPLDLFNGPLAAFAPCDTAPKTGCVHSWTAYPEGRNARMIADRATVWENQALSVVNRRPLLCTRPQGDDPSLDGIHCTKGVLRVPRESAVRLRTAPYRRRPFHTLTVDLFQDAIAEDVGRRIRAFDDMQNR